jgi:hypothetical protein
MEDISTHEISLGPQKCNGDCGLVCHLLAETEDATCLSSVRLERESFTMKYIEFPKEIFAVY